MLQIATVPINWMGKISDFLRFKRTQNITSHKFITGGSKEMIQQMKGWIQKKKRKAEKGRLGSRRV